MRASNPYQMHRKLFSVGVAVICMLIVGTNGTTCRKGCPQSDNNILQYTPGNVYDYNFDSIMTVGFGGSASSSSDTDDISLKIHGTAKMYAEGNCGYTIQLSTVKVSATKESVEKKIMQSIQKPVHFTMVGGKLESEICSDASDNEYALNVKRAVISLLQSNTEESNTEIDVFGQCMTHTSVSKVGNAEIISKVRNLNNCAYRTGSNSGFIDGVINNVAGIKSAPILKASYAKESKVVNGIVDNVHLVEEYSFVLAPKGSYNVRAKVVTTMKITNPAGSAANAPASGTESESIIFHKPGTYATKNLAALKIALTELVQLLDDYVQKDSGKAFVELIRLMRQSSSETLLELASFPLPNKVLARKVFFDSLFRTGTSESAKAILKQLNKMDEKEKTLAMLSLNIVKTVDKDTVTQAAALLAASAPKQVYLAVGNLVAKYCKGIGGCESGDIEAISKKFIDNLKHCKPQTKKDEERIIYVLKGIGNMKNFAGSSVNALSECAAPERPIRIRVAALQAFAATSCDPTLQAKAMSLLRDRNEDSELRIEAYLALTKCPKAELANEIAEIVNSETVYQVGGFIASHLKTIRDSTDATRAKQRYYLGNIRVTKQFPKDVRRYSFNNELSYAMQSLGAGASVDYKLIYAQHGFLPRSARLNITTELFGTDFNIFEVSLRQENIENVFEYYFGPKGLFNKDFDEIMSNIDGSGRVRRSIADESAKFTKKYKTYGSKNINDVNLDLSLKFFGNEMSFLSLGDNIPGSLDDIIKYFSSGFDNVKKELSSFKKVFNMHSLFLDSELAYTTGLGIPLELHMQGFSASKFDLGVNVDVDALLENWQQAKYQLKIVPSVDVNMNVHFGFNAYVLATGLRVDASMHSATGGDINLAFISNGNGFTMDVELPRENIELIDLQAKPDFYVAEQDKPIKSIPFKDVKNHKSDEGIMCFNQLESIGINVCVASSINLQTGKPQSGDAESKNALLQPFMLSIYVESERKYNLKGIHNQLPSGNQQWKLDFSTPGSKQSHDASLAFELGTKPRTYGRLTFDNALYHLALEAGFNNDNKEIVLYAQYENNGETKKNRIGFVKNGNEYRPVIEIQDKNGVVNDINGYSANGRVIVQQTGEKQSRYSFENFQVTNKKNERVVVNGWADVGPAQLNSELHIAPNDQSYFVKTDFELGQGVYKVGLFVNDDQTPNNVYGSTVTVKVANQAYGLTWLGKIASWEFNTDSSLSYVMLEDSTTITSSQFNNKLVVKHKNNVVSSWKLDGRTEPNKLALNIEAESGKKTASLTANFNWNRHLEGDYIAEINGKYNKHFVDVIAKCDIVANHYVIDNTLTTSWGTTLSAKGELGQRYSAQDIFVDLQGAAQFSGKDKPVQWILKILGTPEKTTSEFKLARDSADLIKYTGELQHPQDKVTAGKMNLNIKNVVNGKADFKLAKNGKGEFNVNIETQKTEPKHKIDVNSKFNVQAPKYDVEVVANFDGEKKFSLKTENAIDKKSFTTKNVAEFGRKQIAFDANAAFKGDWRINGEMQGDFAFTCPEGRKINGKWNQKINTNAKTGQVQGNMETQLNDNWEGKQRTLVASVKADKFNWKTKDIVENAQISFTNFDGKKLDVTAHVKHLPKGTNKMLDVQTSVRGDIITVPIDLSFVVDEYSVHHAIYKLGGNFGKHGNANVNGKYQLAVEGTPATYEVQLSLNAPESNFKTMQISSSGKVVKPAIEDGGKYLVELHFDERAGNNQYIRLNSVLQGSQMQGSYVFDVQTHNMPTAAKIEGTYQRESHGSLREGNATGQQKYTFNYHFADKYVRGAVDLGYSGSEAASLHWTFDSSFQSLKAIELLVRMQQVENDVYTMHVESKNNGKVYVVDTKFYRSSHKKGIDIQSTDSSGKPISVVGVLEILGERKAKLTVNVKNIIDLDLSANAEASYKGVDDFYIVAQWHSDKLNLNNYDLDVRSQNKAIKFNLKNAQGVVFAGSATYALKKEKNKAIIEGQGQLQYLGKTQNTNFRLIRQIYDMAIDKEFGFSYTFNGNFGPKNGVSTLKITNKDFNVKLSVCEEKKQCMNVQVQSIVRIDENELDSTQNSLLVLIDLRELGYPYEFELQSKTIKQGFNLQYSLDSNIVSNNNLKYQLVANVLPSNSKVQLKLPKREILLQIKQKYPKEGTVFGHYEQSATFYFDKINKPNDVTSLAFKADLSGNEYTTVNARGELVFAHPTIRPLTISGKFDANRQQQLLNSELIFDIFRVPEQQIIVSVCTQNMQQANGFNITTSEMIRSSGLGLQYQFNGHVALNVEQKEFSAVADVHTGLDDLTANSHVYVNKDKIDASVTVMNVPVVQMNGEANRQKYAVKFNTKLHVFSQDPVVLIADLSPSTAKLNVKSQGLLDASADLKLGKEFKVNVDGSGKQLFNGRIVLDSANFLQTTYTSNEEDIKAFLNTAENALKKDSEVTINKIKQRFQKLRATVDRQAQQLKDSVPDFSQLKNTYETNINEVVKELENDPSLKQISETYHKIYTKIAEIFGVISKATAESYEKLHQSIVALYDKWDIVLKDSILPIWEEFLVQATRIVGQLRIEIVNLLTKTVKTVWSVFEQYGPALKNYGKVINETLKPFNDALQELAKVLVHAAEEFISELNEYIAKFPTFEAIRAEIKNKIEKLRLVEKSLEFIDNLFEQLHIIPQTPESTEFLQKAREYIEAKLKNQPIGDEKALEELVKLLMKALRSLWNSYATNLSLEAAGGNMPGNAFATLFSTPSISWDLLDKVPMLIFFRSSYINFLLNENWENILTTDHFKSWVFFDDFELRGHVADGQHIFTFDGQTYAFPGSCKYILAQDCVDNNFTVIAQLNNGKLKSVTLTDRDGNFMEIADNGALKVNGNPAEYPQHIEGEMHAWRIFYTVWMRSEYGVEVMCTNELKVCHVNVNGFYTSKTRGLLGNGNAEPYDDLVQPDGTLASNYASMGNGYGLGKCNPVAAEADNTKHVDICTEFFGLDSPLVVGYIFIDPSAYRKACDAAVSTVAEKDKETAACNIATAYGSALKLQEKFVRLPTRCLKCAGAPGQRDLGQEFSVKIPNNKADLVFVVDVGIESVVMSNLIAPAISEVRESLKTRGLTDVQVAVIAYNESQLYPALLTSDNGKINYQGDLNQVHLNGPKPFCLNCVSQIVVDPKIMSIYEVIENVIRNIEPQSDEKAFELALNYPFRAAAAKSIIGVRSSTLGYGNLSKLLRAYVTGSVTKFDGALLHLISPVQDMSLEGVPAGKLVGFNSRLIATLDGKDAKKRQKLQFENDMGIDFVLDNGGWVFATQNFDKLKPAEQKKALNQVTNSIADTLFKTEIVGECECKPVHGLHAQHKCFIKSSNFVPNKKVKAALPF